MSAVLAGCGAKKGKETAERAVVLFHQRLDGGDFSAIYGATHPDFKTAASEKDFVALLAAIHRKLGTVRSTSEVGWNVNSFNLKTNVNLTYKTAFTDGDATESFSYRITGSLTELRGYNINSTALITK